MREDKACAAFKVGEYDWLLPIKHIKQPCKRCGRPYDEHEKTDSAIKNFTIKKP